MRHLASDDHGKCPNYHEYMEEFLPKLRTPDDLPRTNFQRKRSYSNPWTSQYYLYSNKHIIVRNYTTIVRCSQCTKIDIERATSERERLNASFT